MAEFKEKGYRYDPYKNFRFRIRCNGKHVAGISKVDGLESVQVPAEGSNNFSPANHPANGVVILERGLTLDMDFHQWACASLSVRKKGAENSSKYFTKDIVIELYNEAGQLTAGFNVHQCRVSAYQFIPEQGGEANSIVIDHLSLENDGCDRDTTIPDPAGPDYKLPT